MRFARNVHRALLFANGPVEFSRAGEAFMCVRSSRTPLILCLCSTLTLALILGLPQPLLSQSQSEQGYLGDIGKPNFEAMSAIESGFINLNNGNLHLEFPIASVPQRGNLPFSAKLIYDSRIWNYNPTAQTSGWGALGGGWKLAMTGTQYTTFVSDFYVTDSIQHVNCGGTVTSTIISGFMLTAADGTQHSFPGQLVWDGPSGGCQSQVLSLTSYAKDGSGYLFVGTKNNPITAIYDNIGTQVFPSYVDANGNLFTHNSNNDTVDSRGTVPVQTTVSGNVTYLDVSNSQGTRSRYTITYETINVSTNFGLSTVGENTGTLTIVQSIGLPNGTSYSFTYDSGTTPGHYGLLAGMTLPTGASVSFGYTNFSDARCVMNRWISGRTVAGNTWTYVPTSLLSPCDPNFQPGNHLQQVQVTKPNGDTTNYIFNNGWTKTPNTEVDYYSGAATGLPIKKEIKDYYSDTASSPLRLTTQLLNGSSYISSKSEYVWDTSTGTVNGNLTQIKDWGFYTGTPPDSPYRTTTITYLSNSAYQARNIIARPSSIVVTDSTGATVSQTNYGYDTTAIATTSGATQHDYSNYSSTYTTRGNLTTVATWLNTTNSYLTTTQYYDDLGNRNQTQDPGGHNTFFSYADSWGSQSGANACPPSDGGSARNVVTQLKNHLGQTTDNTYYSCTSLAASTTDLNAHATSFGYDGMNRLTQTTDPDGGNTTLSYNDTIPPLSVTATKLMTSGIPVTTVTIVDNLGRTMQTQLTTDPDGTDYSDTTYDVLSRVWKQSNPHRNSPLSSDGTTTTYYDALGRICLLVPSDGTSPTGNPCSGQPPNTIFTSYSGNTSTTTNQAGNGRRSVSDGFGRLIELDEPGAGASSAVAGSGSASIGGPGEQSIGGAPPTSGTGWVNISGTLQSTQVLASAATSGTGTVTITGSQRTVTINQCPPRYCPTTAYDVGRVSVTVNGVTDSVNYPQASGTAAQQEASIASALASKINSDNASPVSASALANVVTLTAKATGASSNYSFSATSATTNTRYFSGTSYPVSTSGPTLTNGQNATYNTVYDSGTATVTVNSHSSTTPSWSGSGTTAQSIATSMMNTINGDSAAFVTASTPTCSPAPSNCKVTLTAKNTGAATNYSLSYSSTFDSSHFSSASFTVSDSGSNLVNGSNGTATVYDSGTVWITVAGFRVSVPYGQNDTQSTVAAALVSALNVPSSPVLASVNGTAVNMQSKAAGANTNYTLSGGSSSNQPGSFPQPSFSVSVTAFAGAASPVLSLSTAAITTYTYDVAGNLTGVTQSGSRQRTFHYDSLSRLISATNPESGTLTYNYDSDTSCLSPNSFPGLLASKVDARGVRTCYQYDALNRPTKKSYSDGTAMVTYGYDGVPPPGCTPPPLTINNGVGKRTGMCDAAGAEAWSYDIVSGTGWKTTDARTTANVTLTTIVQSNLDGSTKSITYPSGHVLSYAPGGAGRPLSATDSTGNLSYVSNAQYWPSGTLAAMSNNAGSISFSTILNPRLQPCWIYATTGSPLSWTSTSACNASAATGNILDLKYSFNLGSANNGNVANITNNRDTTRSQIFAYDALNRLTAAQTTATYSTSPSNCFGESFGYDAWGNLLSVSQSSSSYDGCTYEQPQVWTITANNQIQNSATCFDTSGNLLTVTTYCYDAAGNLLTNTAVSFAYDAENHIKSIPMLGISYLYDGDGRRVAKLNSSGQATKIYWYGMGSNPLDETDGTGATNNVSFLEYAFFNGERISRRDASNNVSYYFADHLGTARVLTNATGSICFESDFYPFGGERSLTVSCGNNYRFTGKERDPESGLDYLTARYSSATIGRLMSPDPLYFQAMMLIDPQRFNLYGYGRDNPLEWADPFGERLFLFGNVNWLLLNILYELAGGEDNFNMYFHVDPDGEVVLNDPGIGPVLGSAGLMLIYDLVTAHDNYVYYAGTSGMDVAKLFQDTAKKDGKLNARGKKIANEFTCGGGRTSACGMMVGTSGRLGSDQPANLANGDAVFAVIAYNTGAVQTQVAIDYGKDPDYVGPLVIAAEAEGLHQAVKPVSLFIHESEENLAFRTQLDGWAKTMNYDWAHSTAIGMEAIIRRELHIGGGFAGAQVSTTVPH